MSKEQFDMLRKGKNYKELGNFFFLSFILYKKGKARKRVSKLWESLTEKEKALCEEV